jgi:3',5'-cyclic AMP phosphodiesterase CpdA
LSGAIAFEIASRSSRGIVTSRGQIRGEPFDAPALRGGAGSGDARMTVVAHVTDLHLVERDHHRRGAAQKSRLLYLNSGRKLDPEVRLDHAREALRRAARCDHVVVTGDLTEDGTEAQFELLAELLHESALAPERVTLVPGNHDIYERRDGFEHALEGPLRAFARTSALGQPLELGASTVLVPVSTAIPQRMLLSAGALAHNDRAALDRLARDPAVRGSTLLVAQHHPPLGHRNPIWNWIDGMAAAQRNASLLCNHAHMHVLHGHTHERKSLRVRLHGPEQVHSGAAVVMSSDHVRFYSVGGGELQVLDLESAVHAPKGAVANLGRA